MESYNTIFSIIIPTYNSGSTIEKALKSILEQSFSNYEILIVDGLSTDNTMSLAKGFCDERIKIISEKDEGIYDAMNKGIKMAKANYLLFLGSDDYLFHQNVLAEVNFKISKKPSYKFFYGNVKISGDGGWTTDQNIYDGEFTIDKLLIKNIAHQAIFYHYSVFEACGDYNLKYKVCSDYDFNLKAAAKFKLCYLDIIVAVFNSGGLSTQGADRELSTDIGSNLINYFFSTIYKPLFKKFEIDILIKARKEFKKMNLDRSIYLFAVGFYFKAQRKLGLND